LTDKKRLNSSYSKRIYGVFVHGRKKTAPQLGAASDALYGKAFFLDIRAPKSIAVRD
jgi:hypothetical protein